MKVDYVYSGETKTDTDTRDFMVSALVNPYQGVKVSAGYVYAGNSSAGGKGSGDGAWNAAVDVNIAKIIDLDFDLGASVSYVGLYDDEDDDVGTIIAAQVYGGIDLVSGGVEFAYIWDPCTDSNKESMTLSVFAELNFLEQLPITVYLASTDLEEFGDNFLIGATAEYELNGVGLGLVVEYLAKDVLTGTTTGASLNYAEGFEEGTSIMPYISFRF